MDPRVRLPEFQFCLCSVALGMLLNLSVPHFLIFTMEVKTDYCQDGWED